MSQEPKFIISGTDRRELKKELNDLKQFVRTFWYFHQIEEDMGICMMTLDDAEIMFKKKVEEVMKIEYKLNQLK